MIPTFVCRSVYVGLHQHHIPAPSGPGYVGFSVPRSTLGHNLYHTLTLPRGSPPTLVPETGAVLQTRMKGHTRFTKPNQLDQLSDIIMSVHLKHQEPNLHLLSTSTLMSVSSTQEDFLDLFKDLAMARGSKTLRVALAPVRGQTCLCAHATHVTRAP